MRIYADGGANPGTLLDGQDQNRKIPTRRQVGKNPERQQRALDVRWRISACFNEFLWHLRICYRIHLCLNLSRFRVSVFVTACFFTCAYMPVWLSCFSSHSFYEQPQH